MGGHYERIGTLEPIGHAAARVLAELEARKRKQGQGKPGMAPLPLRTVANARPEGSGVGSVGFGFDTKAVTENTPDRSKRTVSRQFSAAVSNTDALGIAGCVAEVSDRALTLSIKVWVEQATHPHSAVAGKGSSSAVDEE